MTNMASRYFSFILSGLGIFLVFLLYLHLFNYKLTFELKDTLILHVQDKGAPVKQISQIKEIKPIAPIVEKANIPVTEKPAKQQGVVRGVAFGDTHFTRGFTYYIEKGNKKEEDYFRCFTGEYSSIFDTFDIVGVNFQSSIAGENQCPSSDKSIIFRTDPIYVGRLKSMGFMYYNLANSHTYDCGYDGYAATKTHLDSLGLKYFGEGRKGDSVILKEEINGLKIAQIGMENVEVKLNLEEKVEKIKALKEEGYIVLVNIHFGIENAPKHSEAQEFIAHSLVDAGAGLIIGHHPHVIQDYEEYKGVPIYYSLGNFLFDQPFPDTLEGLAVSYEITKDGVVDTKTVTFERDAKYYDIKDCSVFKGLEF